MRKLITFFVCVLAIQLAGIAMTNSDRVLTFEQLPVQAQELIKEYFADHSIALIKVDKDVLSLSYEVIFTNGNRIEFDRRGEWIDIDYKYASLPAKLIPGEIEKYVSDNFPDSRIIKIEKEHKNGYEVELLNGVELTFDSKYKLINIEY